jgi:hypothetical protein
MVETKARVHFFILLSKVDFYEPRRTLLDEDEQLLVIEIYRQM